MLTVLSLARWSLVGITSRAPQTLRSSSRARTCHCGCIARRIVVHVSMLEVVCLPAKKNVLHSSTMSSTVTLFLFTVPEVEASWIIIPSKSLGPFITSSSPHAFFSFLRSMRFTSDLLISLSNFQQLIFLLVGKNLKQWKKNKQHIQGNNYSIIN